MLVYFSNREQYSQWINGKTVTVSIVPMAEPFKSIIVSPLEVESYNGNETTVTVNKKY